MIQKENGVQNVLQTVQMKAPVKNREIGKNRCSFKLFRSKSLGNYEKKLEIYFNPEYLVCYNNVSGMKSRISYIVLNKKY